MAAPPRTLERTPLRDAAELPRNRRRRALCHPGGLTASVIHLGPYHELGMAHAAIRAWCAAHHHRLAGPRWEIYGHWQSEWNDDPSRIRTDVFYQLVS